MTKEQKLYNEIRDEIIKRTQNYISDKDESNISLECWIIKFKGKLISGNNKYFWVKKQYAKTALWGLICGSWSSNFIYKTILDDLENMGIIEYINLLE
jgi:hypothetical protein